MTRPVRTRHSSPLVFLALLWVIGGFIALVVTWPTDTNPYGSKPIALLRCAVTLLAATVCGIGAAVLAELRHRA